MIRYSLRDLFIALGAVGAGLAIATYLGRVFASYYGLLVFIGYGSTLIPIRMRWWSIGLGAAAAVSAHVCGVPGSSFLLPTIDFPPLQVACYPFYLCGEAPLYVIGNVCGSEFREVILFTGSSGVRPSIVLGFWFGIALTLATPLVTARIRAIRKRRRSLTASSTG